MNSDSFIIGDAIGYYNPMRLTKGWNLIVRLLGIRGIEGRYPALHDLPHTWATLFLAAGGDVKTAASNLGHSNAAMMLNVYASADPDAKRRTAMLTERAMLPEGGGAASEEGRGTAKEWGKPANRFQIDFAGR